MTIRLPIQVTVQMKDEKLIEDMDGYDPDSEDEEAISWLGVEQGNSMETFEAEDMDELHEMMTHEYKDYIIADNDLAEYYSDWKEVNAK